jgi:hypothetical protein
MLIGNNLAGRRGWIKWKKENVVGVGGETDCDTYYAFIVFGFPVRMISLIHLFGVSKIAGPRTYIPLRMDRGFTRAAVMDGVGLLAMIFLFAAFALGCGSLVKSTQTPLTLCIALGIGGGLCLLAGVGLWIYGRRNRLDDRRDVDIRLILGKHEWGSSDPIYWTDEFLADVVEPVERFECDTYAKLTSTFIETQTWCAAMWAARLCAATEDSQQGETLTESILARPGVQAILKSLRLDASRHGEFLGERVLLSNWVKGEPAQRVSTMMFN